MKYILLILTIFISSSTVIAKDAKKSSEKINSAQNLYLLGLEAAENKNYSEAIEFYNKSVLINPEQPTSIYLNRGYAKEKINDFQGAEADYLKAAQHEPDFATPYIYYGDFKTKQKKYPEALTLYNKALALSENKGYAYHQRAKLKILMKNYASAIEDLNLSLAENMNNDRTYLTRAIAKTFIEDYNGALADLNQALVGGSENPEFYFLRGSIRALILKKYPQAYEDFQKGENLVLPELLLNE